MEEKRIKLKAFLARYFRKHELTDDEDIYELGFVNSLFALQLVMFIEKEFNITIGNDLMKLDNFRSVNTIVSLLEKSS